VHGIARDLAAAGLGKFKDAAIAPVKGTGACPYAIKLDFGTTPSLCRAFALRLVRGVKNGPSPEWLARRLTAIGLVPSTPWSTSPISSPTTARPLHVFDAAKVRGNLVVRRAAPASN